MKVILKIFKTARCHVYLWKLRISKLFGSVAEKLDFAQLNIFR